MKNNIYQTLLKGRVHLGHHQSMTHPLMQNYVYGRRKGREIFDLRQTLFHLKLSQKLIAEVLQEGGIVLFHIESQAFSQLLQGRIPQHPLLAVHHGNWVGGLLTNWEELQNYPLSLKGEKWNQLPAPKKKTVTRKFAAFFHLLKGKKEGDQLIPRPSLLVSFKVRGNEAVLREAQKMKIPTIGILDSDANPEAVTYGIPANDDDLKALYLYSQIFLSPFEK